MTQSPRTSGPRPPAGLSWRLALARLAVAWERAWPALWPAAAVLALFLTAAFVDLLPALGPWGHALALLGFLAAFAWTLARGVRRVVWPGQEDARRRLERDSGLDHRPLSALDDRLASSDADPAAAALWQAHLERLRATIRRLRIKPPRGSLAGVDPVGLRAVPLLLLVIGVAVAGGQAGERLLRAALPAFPSAEAAPPQVDVWLDPPAYTGIAPRFLETASAGNETMEGGAEDSPNTANADTANGDAAGTPADDGPVAAPDGSRLLAQVQGGAGEPRLVFHGRGADTRREVAFERVAEGAWKAEVELDMNAGPKVTVHQGERELAGWTLEMRPDRAPRVSFQQAPQRTQRASLRVAYRAEDDYGLESVRLRMVRPDGDGEADANASANGAGAEALVVDLPLPGRGVAEAEQASFHDLSAHVWAGTEVRATLVAEDARGQTGTSDPVTLVLPERTFQHPVARRLVELRKQLTLEPDNRYPVIQELARLGRAPQLFSGDVVAALGIRSAERRLIYDKRAAAIAEVQETLWRTALRIEEGDLSMAERDLRRAERALEEALARDDVDDAEIQRLMDELESAMNRFLQELAQQMQRQMEQGVQPQPIPPDAQVLNQQDLRNMLEQMRQMSETGQRDAARQMLSQLREMLENLRANPMMGQQSEQAQRAMQMMQDMQSLTERQQELLDQSFRLQQEMRRGGQQGQNQQRMGEGQPRSGQPRAGQQGQMGQQGQHGLAQRQEALRRSLGRMMRELGDMLGNIPRPLGEAEQRMRDATRALQGERPGQATGPQQQALDQLRQGMNSMRQQMQQQMGQQPGQGQGRGQTGWRPGQPRDPLGRAQEEGGTAASGDDVRIPDRMDLQRAREILNELRRRSGDRARPEYELDYIDRLLNRF